MPQLPSAISIAGPTRRSPPSLTKNHPLPLRNHLWASAGPLVCANPDNDISDKTVRQCHT